MIESSAPSLGQCISNFAVDLFHQLRPQEGNLFFSPFSIATVLTTAYAGAQGITASQMESALRLTLKPGKAHPAYQSLITRLFNCESMLGYKLQTANALWIQKEFEVLQAYLGVISHYYGEAIFAIDFRKTEAARQRINTWVEKLTNGFITNLLPPGSVTQLTKLILTNAIYFKGLWASQFKEGNTQQAPFMLHTGESVQVPMMYQKGKFGYFEGLGVQALDLPYFSNRLSMVIFLPQSYRSFVDFEAKLTNQQFSEWISRLHPRQVRVFLPRFSMTTEFELSNALQNLGMVDAFSEKKADFSGMTELPLLFITAVLHKAFVEVNEEGTEAAAVTAVVMAPKGIGAAPPIPVFRADHPFLFCIRDNHTNTILFMGRVMNPTHKS